MYEKRDKMTDILTFTVYGVEGEMKIRDYMTARLGFSASLIGIVKYDNVLLNGNPVHMRAMVQNGDVITVNLPQEESENIEPIAIPLEIVYEDRYILAVNKPTNMPTHPARGNHLPTLANAVRAHLNKPFVFRALTRLDRDTSGIVLIAKNRLAAALLSKELQKGNFRKIYEAVVVGTPEPKAGRIDAPIAREAENSIKRVVRDDGKPATTVYNVISVDDDGNATVELEAVTGRTHQLRVHMAHIGHPLYSDFLYGTQIGDEVYRLHCKMLEFPHPASGERITLLCPVKK